MLALLLHAALAVPVCGLDVMTGEVLSRVTVVVDGATVGTTDATGCMDVAAGSTVTFQAPGLLVETAEVLKSPVTLEGYFEDPGASVDEVVLETVVRDLTPTRTVTTASTTELAPSDLATASLRTTADAVRLVPGFVLVQHGSEGKGNQYFTRGFDALHGADIETRLGGIPFNEWSNIHGSGYLDLTLIPPEAVNSVRVTKGPFSIDQGPFAVAGSIDYELGVGTRGLRASYSAGTTNRHRLLLSYAPEDEQSNSFITGELVSDAGFGEQRASRRGGAVLRHTLWSDPANTITAFAAGSASSFELPGTVRLDDVAEGRIDLRDSYDDGLWRGETQRAVASVSLERGVESVQTRAHLWGALRGFELLENYTGFLQSVSRDPQDLRGDAVLQRHRSAQLGFELQQERLLGERLSLLSAASARGERVSQSEQRVDAQGSPYQDTRGLEGWQSLWHLGSALRYQIP
ncbi:MAG: TonB-dependent receptor plug domain-containing protein, partial [Myxococcota bacterium]